MKELDLFEDEESKQRGINFFEMKKSVVEESLQLLKNTSLYDKKYEICKFYYIFPKYNFLVFNFEFYCHLLGMLDLNGTNIESFPPPEIRSKLCQLFQCEEDDDQFPHW